MRFMRNIQIIQFMLLREKLENLNFKFAKIKKV